MKVLKYFQYCFPVALVTTLVCGCGDWELKKAIREYRGAGQIQYLKAPLLGVSGCAIRMPPLDLSQPVHVQYDFTGIPPGRGKYWIYLIVPEPCPLEGVLQGAYHLQVMREHAKIRDLESKLKDMKNARGSQENRFYFYVSDLDQEQSGIDVQESTATWSISVSYTNHVVMEPVKAYILITRGGCK